MTSATPGSLPGSALDLLTGDAQVFCEKAWASRVHLHRTDPALLTRFLGFDDVDHLLTETAFRAPAIRMARDGRVLPESAYTRAASLAGRPLSGLVDPRKVAAEFDAGASIVLQGLHRYWPPLADLVRRLELELGHPCQANAYLTPPGSQGFAVHSDTHDVFVFQTAGRKQWEVHDASAADGAGRTDVVLEPGVAMYLPTGTPHAARAQESASLHVTVGVNQVTWRDLVRRCVDPLLREVDTGPLPAGYLQDPGALRGGLAERLEALAERVRGLDADDLVAAEVDRVLTTRSPDQRGLLLARLAAVTIDDDTLLVRDVARPCVLRRAAEPDRVRLLLGDRVLTLPSWVSPALEVVADRAHLRPGDLADHLDPESRLVLCRRLVREGLLRPRAT